MRTVIESAQRKKEGWEEGESVNTPDVRQDLPLGGKTRMADVETQREEPRREGRRS